MHLGEFPNGVEFSTFVMARNNYPFEKMALEDHRLPFDHERAIATRIEDMQQNTRLLDDRTLLGRWTAPGLSPGLVVALQDFLETGKGMPAFYWLLTRRE